MNKEISTYNEMQADPYREICYVLSEQISKNLPGAEGKIWHANPVWFLDGNPVVGYSKLKDCISLLFWSGQTFEEDKLKKNGKFKAAEMRYTLPGQINLSELEGWLKKSEEIQWDYKNIVKRKGKLERLK